MMSQRKAELTFVMKQMMSLIDRLDELSEDQRAELSALSKRSPEYRAGAALCDGMDDAIDSLTDAIHCLEDAMEDEG